MCVCEPLDFGDSIMIDGLSGTFLLKASSVYLGLGQLIIPKTLTRDDNLIVTEHIK